MHVQPASLQHGRPRREMAFRGDGDVVAHHHLGEVAGGGLRRGLAHDPPGPQHHDAVGDRPHLVEFVADEEHRPLLVADPADGPEQLLDLLRGENSRRFIEDQHARVAVEHLEDLHSLPLPDRELPDVRCRVYLEPVLVSQPPHMGSAVAQIKKEARLPPPQEDVFCDREGIDQPEVLMHHADAPVDGVTRGAQFHSLPAEENCAFVRPVQTCQDAHERRLSRAIFTQQSQNLPREDGEVDPGVRHYPREGLDDALESDERVRHGAAHFAVGDCPSMPWSSQLNPRISASVIVLPAATRTLPL